MNEDLVEQMREGLNGLRNLLAGKHLRPAELALTIIFVSLSEESNLRDLLLDRVKQARWENANATS